jgi:hypothetical protein
MMRHTAIGIYSTGKILLDGVIASPNEHSAKAPAVLVCHPHPMLGGDMNNPIVSMVSFLANEQGLASLQFDFRGVGQSEGDFSNGENEWDDVKHALQFLRNFPGVDKNRVGVVGYSFGASVVLHSLPKLKAAKSFALIAPPLAAVKDPEVNKDKRDKLFIVGQDDRVVPSTELQRLLDGLGYPVQFTEIPGADHRLSGHEQAVAERVVEFMLENL